jgi:hypothetical protein
MIIEGLIVFAVAAGAAIAFIALMAARRARHYRLVLAELAKLGVERNREPLNLSDWQALSFAKAIVSVADFLPKAKFEELRSEAERLAGAERSYVPAHKKGGTIAYETLIARAPAIVSLYHSEALQRFVSRVVGVAVGPTPLHDQSSLSVLVYDRPGDHIGWHYDHNFYRGRHFTLLLPVVNIGRAADGISHAQLSAKIDGEEQPILTAPNTLVLFEGAKVLHKVSPIIEGERRVVISMTYCADPQASFAQAVARRIKDTAFYGIRALWT